MIVCDAFCVHKPNNKTDYSCDWNSILNFHIFFIFESWNVDSVNRLLLGILSIDYIFLLTTNECCLEMYENDILQNDRLMAFYEVTGMLYLIFNWKQADNYQPRITNNLHEKQSSIWSILFFKLSLMWCRQTEIVEMKMKMKMKKKNNNKQIKRKFKEYHQYCDEYKSNFFFLCQLHINRLAC